MTNTFSKLCSKRGETLVEMLVSILILGLAISVMTVMISAAYGMNKSAREADEKYYSELAAAESQSADGHIGSGTLYVSDGASTFEIGVDIFGGDSENSLRSYTRSGAYDLN